MGSSGRHLVHFNLAPPSCVQSYCGLLAISHGVLISKIHILTKHMQPLSGILKKQCAIRKRNCYLARFRPHSWNSLGSHKTLPVHKRYKPEVNKVNMLIRYDVIRSTERKLFRNVFTRTVSKTVGTKLWPTIGSWPTFGLLALRSAAPSLPIFCSLQEIRIRAFNCSFSFPCLVREVS